MKILLSIFTFLVTALSVAAQVRVPGVLTNGGNAYPVAPFNMIQGSPQIVDTMTALSNTPSWLRSTGQLFHVLSPESDWRLVGGTNNANLVEVVVSASAFPLTTDANFAGFSGTNVNSLQLTGSLSALTLYLNALVLTNVDGSLWTNLTGTNNNFTGMTNWGSPGRTNKTYMDARGWHNTNTSGANLGVDISGGDVQAQRVGIGMLGATLAIPLTVYGGGAGTIAEFRNSTGTVSYASFTDNSTGAGSPNGLTVGYNNAGIILNRESTSLYFGTADETRWLINVAGHFTPLTDNTHDFGDTTHRVRTGYFGTSLGIGTTAAPAVKLQINGSGGTTAIGTEDELLLYRPQAANVYGQGAAFALGSYAINSSTNGFGPSSRLDIKLKATADNVAAADVTVMSLLDTRRVGIGTTAPEVALEINHDTGQALQLNYSDADGSAANKVNFVVSQFGDLVITPSGGDVFVATNITAQYGSFIGNGDGLTNIDASKVVGNAAFVSNAVVITASGGATAATSDGGRTYNIDVSGGGGSITNFGVTGSGANTATTNGTVVDLFTSGLDPRFTSSAGTITLGSNTFAATTIVGTKVFADELNATNASSLTMTAAGQTLTLGSGGLTLSGSGAGYIGPVGNATIDASGFNGVLTTSDNTIQEALQKLDDLSLGGGGSSLSNITDSGYVALVRSNLVVTGGAVDMALVVTNGKVGIGAGPVNKLDVEGGAVIGAGYSGTSTSPVNGLLVQGPVGINQTSIQAGYFLEVSGEFRVSTSGSSVGQFSVDQGGSGGASRLIMSKGSGAAGLLIDAAGNSYFNTSGNFGIGTNAPFTQLHVVGNAVTSGTNQAAYFVGDGSLLTGISGGVSDGDKGDITVSGSGATWTVDNDAIALGTKTTGNYAAGDGEAGGATVLRVAAGSGTLSASGQVSVNTTGKMLGIHNGTKEVALPLIQHREFSFDPKAVCDGAVDRLFLFKVGAWAPNGITITGWRVSFEADPTTEVDLDLKRADAFIGVANSAVMDVLDTTTGASSEATAANINSGAVVANGKVVYLEFGAAYTETTHQVIFEIEYEIEED